MIFLVLKMLSVEFHQWIASTRPFAPIRFSLYKDMLHKYLINYSLNFVLFAENFALFA